MCSAVEVVYVGWHDGQGNPKGYTYDVGKALTCWSYPDNMADAGVGFNPAYDVVIGPMKGDWFDAASVYRRWAHRQFWCRCGPKSTWPADVKESVLEVPYWARPDWCGRDGKYNAAWARTEILRMKNEERWLGRPLGVLWYGWHFARFDGNYPEYFPMLQGFAEETRRETAAGWTVCPFINGLWFDLKTPKGAEARPWGVTQDPDGKNAPPDPKTINPLMTTSVHASMCPTSAWWYQELAAIGQRVHREAGAQMLYLDVTANAGPLPCFDRRHPHPPGRGRWWAEGMNRELQAIKAAPDGIKYVQSECFNETLGASLDTQMIWTDKYPFECPMLGAIYGGWLGYYGSRVFDFENLTSYTIKLTRDVFWGGAIGTYINEWWAQDIGSPKANPWACILRDLVNFRRVAGDYLVYGEMVRPPRLVSPPVWITQNGWHCDYVRPIEPNRIEAIERVAWRSPDGKVGLAVMNCDETPHDAEFDLASVTGLKVAATLRVIQGKTAVPADLERKDNRIVLHLPARVPVLVVIGEMSKSQI